MFRASLFVLLALTGVCSAPDKNDRKRPARKGRAPAAVAAVAAIPMPAAHAAAAGPWSLALPAYRLRTGVPELKAIKAPAARLPKPGDVVIDSNRDEVILSAKVQHP